MTAEGVAGRSFDFAQDDRDRARDLSAAVEMTGGRLDDREWVWGGRETPHFLLLLGRNRVGLRYVGLLPY